MGMILLEPPKGLNVSCRALLEPGKKKPRRIRLLKIPWSATASVFEIPFFRTPFSGGSTVPEGQAAVASINHCVVIPKWISGGGLRSLELMNLFSITLQPSFS